MAMATTYPEQQEKFFLKALFPRKKLVYVACPESGDTEKTKEVCREIVASRPDVVPLCPHLIFSFARNEEKETRTFLNRFALLERCDELWLAGNWQNSFECICEKERAEELGMVIREWTLPAES